MGIEDNIGDLINNHERLKKMLALEKERRGYSIDDLIFIGASNIKDYYWCAMQSLYKSRVEEIMFFRQYLKDRLLNSHKLGIIKRFPSKDEKLLEIGNDLTLGDIESLMAHTKEKTDDIKSFALYPV